jgi:hypothetical protein
MDFEQTFQQYEQEPLTRQLVLDRLKDYQRPNDKISELIKSGVLEQVKNGLYVPGPKSKMARPEPFLVANHLRGPSYVSLDSALSHWGMIPERVYEVTSLTTKASRTYKTPYGRFSFFHGPLPYYSFGIRSVSLTSRQRIMIASPEKALCDKIIQTSGVLLRSPRDVQEFLVEDLRMDEDLLMQLNIKEITSWINDAPKKASIAMLVKTLAQL